MTKHCPSIFQLVPGSKRLIPTTIAQIKINQCQPKYVQINLLPLTCKNCKNEEIKMSTSLPFCHKGSKAKTKRQKINIVQQKFNHHTNNKTKSEINQQEQK